MSSLNFAFFLLDKIKYRNMATYKIVRWDPVVFGNNVNPFPMIYIKPDKTFVEFSVENNNTLIVKIDGTDTIYDGHAMVGVVKPSGDGNQQTSCSKEKTVDCRPNFFEKTGLFTITLFARWYEYPSCPEKMGTATFTGLKGKYKVPPVHVPPFKPPVPVQEFYSTSSSQPTCKNLSGWQIGVVVAVFIVILGILGYASFVYKKSL